MSAPEVFVYAGGDLLASAAAARTVTRLADAIAAEGRAHLVLTGGGIGTKVLAAIAADPVTQEWWAVCMPMQRPLPGRAEGEWWMALPEVFHLD